jgi:hypothetical protein
MRDEETGCRRHFDNEELHNLYLFPKVIRMIKSSKKGQGMCSAHGREVHYSFCTFLKIMCEMVMPQNTCIQRVFICVEN